MDIEGLNLAEELRMLKGVKPIDHSFSEPKISEPSKQSFMDFLSKNLEEVNEMGLDVDRRIQETVEGRDPNPHETMIAIQKADVSFRLMLTVKEQLESAYQQLMRTTLG